ncbi:hypothetical protein [Micromonospora sp. M71_S20]|uniref:DUF7169 domain-containing protein n=1 Tax=Micromonospora sp. M71_S20 TaxID=592872 RepID=UPI0011E5BBA6|nr:hypothetical protein [Micromonospora sp. M71_S20]
MTPADLDIDRDAIRMGDLVAALRDELGKLESVLPAAVDAQWTAAPVARPREDTAERMKNRRSDPTGDIALDSDRLRLRAELVRSANVLACGIVSLRQARQAVRDSLTPWFGEGGE